MEPQSQIESRHIAALQEVLEDFPPGALRPNPNDPPDFEVILEGEATHGIELTRLFRPPDLQGISLQAQESERKLIVDRAREEYESRGGVPVFVSIDFRNVFGLQRSPETALSKGKRGRLSKFIVDKVETARLCMGQQTVIEPTVRDSRSWPLEIDDMFVARYPWLTRSEWGAEMGGVVARLTPDILQEQLDRKERRLHRYARRYQGIWLVLVEDGSGLASEFNVNTEEVEASYRSSFDKVVLLRYVRRVAVFLRVVHP